MRKPERDGARQATRGSCRWKLCEIFQQKNTCDRIPPLPIEKLPRFTRGKSEPYLMIVLFDANDMCIFCSRIMRKQ